MKINIENKECYKLPINTPFKDYGVVIVKDKDDMFCTIGVADFESKTLDDKSFLIFKNYNDANEFVLECIQDSNAVNFVGKLSRDSNDIKEKYNDFVNKKLSNYLKSSNRSRRRP